MKPGKEDSSALAAAFSLLNQSAIFRVSWFPAQTLPYLVMLWPFNAPGVRFNRGMREFAVWLALSSLAFAGPQARLADAIEKKDFAAVRTLIGDTDVNASQADGMTALHWAARHDNLDTAKAL